jgi:hypothetical protein
MLARQLFGRNFLQLGLRVLLARVVHESIEATELAHDTVDRVVAKRFAGNVAGDRKAAPTLGFDRAFGLLGRSPRRRDVHRDIQIATSAPSRAKCTATARPMPLSPPVMRAMRRSSFPAPR